MNENESNQEHQVEEAEALADLTVENEEQIKGGAMAELLRKTHENAKTV